MDDFHDIPGKSFTGKNTYKHGQFSTTKLHRQPQQTPIHRSKSDTLHDLSDVRVEGKPNKRTGVTKGKDGQNAERHTFAEANNARTKPSYHGML